MNNYTIFKIRPVEEPSHNLVLVLLVVVPGHLGDSRLLWHGVS